MSYIKRDLLVQIATRLDLAAVGVSESLTGKDLRTLIAKHFDSEVREGLNKRV